MMDHLVGGVQRPPSWISGIGVYGGKRKMNGGKEDGMGKGVWKNWNNGKLRADGREWNRAGRRIVGKEKRGKS